MQKCCKNATLGEILRNLNDGGLRNIAEAYLEMFLSIKKRQLVVRVKLHVKSMGQFVMR